MIYIKTFVITGPDAGNQVKELLNAMARNYYAVTTGPAEEDVQGRLDLPYTVEFGGRGILAAEVIDRISKMSTDSHLENWK